jgi:DNA-binding response OmpR family regulator
MAEMPRTECPIVCRFEQPHPVPACMRAGITLALPPGMKTSQDTLPATQDSPPPTRVFLGEDDREMRSVIASALRRDGFEVIEATNGLDLLHGVQSLQTSTAPEVHDLVVTDVRMPGASGLDVLAVLHTSLPWLPVIVVTGFGDDETHLVAKRLGAVVVLDKPFRMNDLLAVVRRLSPGGALLTKSANTNGVV